MTITTHKTLKEFQSGRGYTKEDWDDVDSPAATAEELAQAKPFGEVFPALAKSIKQEIARRGRPPKEQTKIQVTLRLDPDIIERYKKAGRGWQSRVNDDLRKAAGL